MEQRCVSLGKQCLPLICTVPYIQPRTDSRIEPKISDWSYLCFTDKAMLPYSQIFFVYCSSFAIMDDFICLI